MKANALLAFLWLSIPTNNTRAQFADVTAKFVYQGVAPVPNQLAVIGGVPITSDLLRVNAVNGGIRDITVFPVSQDRTRPLDTSKYDPAVRLPDPVLDHRGFQFVPHIVVMQAGQSLTCKNSDFITANLSIATIDNPAATLMLPPGAQRVLNLPKAERGTSLITNASNGSMLASLFVLDHPFIAVSDANGQLVLKGLAPGRTKLKIIHRVGKFTELKINGRSHPVTKNTFEIELKPGSNDFGTINFSGQEFKP